REIIVGQRGMTYVTRDEDFARRLTGKVVLTVCQRPRLERRVDTDLVLTVGHRVELTLAQAKAPGLAIEGRAIWDPLGPVGQRVQVWSQLGERHATPYRDAVADDVEVRALEVDHASAARILHPGVSDVPLLWHDPVEGGRSGGDLVQRQRHHALQASE